MASTINASTSSGLVATADTSGVLQLQTGGTAAVTVNASQNVGIGTASPSEMLTVAGQIGSRQTTNGAANVLVINSSTGSSANARFRLASDVVIGNLQANSSTSVPQLALVVEGAYPLTFYTSNTERMRLDSSGNLGIGTTSPSNKLVVSNAGANGLEINPNSGVSSGASLNGYNRGTSAYTPVTYTALSHYFQVGSSPATAATLDSSGNLQVPAMYATTVTTPRNVFIDSSGNMGGISSVRASKTNITALDTANWIYQLNPVTFNYRKKDEEGAFIDEFEEEQQFGLIAEDVEAVKPELCIYVDDKLQGVHYDRMIAPLIKAIQEQQAIIQSLTDRVAQLEAK